ncbi:MAG TPA: hypothetical protein VGS09_06905 [Actinomycetota bacterium]|jgi:hypothetical protein|nr:hypothetical protein [Actinomycetota bacterium]
MRTRLAIALGIAAMVSVLVATPATSDPNNDAGTFLLIIEVPNVAEAPNGDQVEVTGEGEFSVHPKSVEAEGTFTHTDSAGNLVAEGTWEATGLLAFEFYGCGVITSPDPDIELPPDLCGGALKMSVLLTVTGPAPIAGFQAEGFLDVFCIIGPQAPESHDEPGEEGIRLVVPGIINFNKTPAQHANMNVYIQTA